MGHLWYNVLVNRLELLGQVDRPELTLPHKIGMMDQLSQITQLMDNDQLAKYKELSRQLSPKVPPFTVER